MNSTSTNDDDIRAELETLKAKYSFLVETVRAYVPYALATLPYPNENLVRNSITTSNPEWIAVHKSRARQSYAMLNYILKLAKPAPESGVMSTARDQTT